METYCLTMELTCRVYRRLRLICGNIARTLNPASFRHSVSGLVERLVIKFSPFSSNKRELLENIKKARSNLEQLTESANRSLRRPSCLPLLLAESTRQSWIGQLLSDPGARVEYLETVDGRKLLVAVILERVK